MIRTVAMWLVALLLLAPNGMAQAGRTPLPATALHAIRRIAVQHNGRTKPFESFARETLKQVTGGTRVGREDPTESLLAMMAEPERWQAAPLIAVPFVPLREALGLDRRTTHVSYDDLVASRTLMKLLPPIVSKQQRDEKLTMLEQETLDAFDRFTAISSVFEQRVALLPPIHTTDRIWRPVGEGQGAVRDAWTALLDAIRAGRAEASAPAATRLGELLPAVNPEAYPARWRLGLELFYNQVGPFRVARFLYLLAALGLLFGLGRSRRWLLTGSLAALWLGFLWHGAGIVIRMVLGGRPPVSNFFESMLWLPFVAVALALIFERIYRVQYFGIAAAILAAVVLWLADAVPLDASIVPVVAVLRSNLWLTVHVLTIVASYGSLALATVLAHIYGLLYLRSRLTAHGSPRAEYRTRCEARLPATLAPLELFLYRALQVGVVLLAGGIMLGAVWANASWGRYWGWDPKETWALITLLWFLAILHGRFAGWIRGVGLAVATMAGFFLLLMTYYGVSFYLTGLHSYAGGHAKPLPPLLIGYLIAELAFIALVGLSSLSRQKA